MNLFIDFLKMLIQLSVMAVFVFAGFVYESAKIGFGAGRVLAK